MTKRWVSWAAVSSLPQAKKISLDEQKRVNLEHIAKHDGALVEHLVVPGQSRSITLFEDACRQIEAYARLHELIKTKAFDVLVYLDRSRLGRKASLIMAVVSLCEDAGIICYETDSPPVTLDAPATHDVQIIGAIKSVGAQNEVERLMERHRKGMIGRIEKGNFASGIPWGLCKVYDHAGKWQIIIEEDKAAAIRKAFDLYLQGLGTRDVAREMNEQGYTVADGSPWSRGAVQYILKAVRLYAGYTEVNRRSPSGRPHIVSKDKHHPAIISEDTMQRVLTEQKSRADSRRAVGSPYLFSRLLTCGVCQHRMHINGYGSKRRDKATGKRYSYCICRCERCHRQCTFKAVRKALDIWVEQISQTQGLLEITDLPEASTVEQTITQLEKQLADNDKAIMRVSTALADGAMDYEVYKAQMKRLDNKRQQITEQMEQAQQQVDHRRQREETIAQLADIVSIYAEMMNLPDVVAVNAWLRSFLKVTFEADRSFTVALL